MGQELNGGPQPSCSCRQLSSQGQTAHGAQELMQDTVWDCQQPLTGLHVLGGSQCEWLRKQFPLSNVLDHILKLLEV